ncbi:MAG TPA: aminoacetone oxidase family FAD-binding enzyme [Flavobacteriales bacterium]|nr:aminoacetone oxidase family FAD-binding enzyme [Flavobacteriales bacterium]|tara:strand:+ start:26945 stop:28156 length:1212 start_codon:yes stop_codon:yes gene_type:complete
MRSILIIGGGAAGFFGAINLAKSCPDYRITILEKSNSVLGKVKISGGGRCNVTHSCFEPKELVKFYPRGKKELLGAFYNFQPLNTIKWFEERGVELKTEEDGRMFPVSNSSQTIIDCFTDEVEKYGVKVRLKSGVNSIERIGSKWFVDINDERLEADDIIMAAGSSSKIWKLLKSLGHRIVEPVPSLFTFNIADKKIHDLAGLSIANVKVKIKKKKSFTTGPLLFTHWGLSAPAILKLSSAEAPLLNELDYKFGILVDFIPEVNEDVLSEMLMDVQRSSTKNIYNHNTFDFPKRFWNYLLSAAKVPEDRIWPELRKAEKSSLISSLKRMEYQVNGKSTFKEEFVTAGGVSLKEVNFKTMESKKASGLYFAGEVINIDGYTGGYNFQAAWTTSYLAASAISKKV